MSEEQSIELLPDTDWQRLTTRVPDDQQTPWWLMVMGANVKVLAPAAWRNELKATAERVPARYADYQSTHNARDA